ncbi:MAG: hypothetical protein JWN44_6690 [Myxococcales bacterium]|nr:hypothetical protein [Myxococcales bacterium]
MKALLLSASLFLLSACINGDFASGDLSVAPPDMAVNIVYDLAGVDLYGAYNCTALNGCERACTTKACVYMCRNMATPTAVQKEIALQGCFQQFCPTSAGKVCEPDAMGKTSTACATCINNTFISNGSSCSPSQTPDECHQCVSQASACTADM